MGKFTEEIYKLYKTAVLEMEEEISSTNDKQPEFGDVFLFSHNKKPIYYLFLNKEGSLFKVLKVSNWWRLANQNDLITEILGERFIVETWNIFYLTEGEYKRSKFLGKIPEEDLKILSDFISGNLPELPKEKRGLTVPEGDYSFVQNKFHRDEALEVKELALRFSYLLEDKPYLDYPPERLEKHIYNQPLTAAEEEESCRGKNFTLFLEKGTHDLVIVPDKEIVGRKALINIFDTRIEVEVLVEEIYLKLPKGIKISSINLDHFCKNISIEVKD